ncbi:MAG TPA: hypothetical protein VM686_13415 [Polyangiaceae bacterium]|nr:hypothetical protein [Polyangiaceae bacterium]
MQQGSAVSCQRCGAIFSASAATCPDCGAAQELASGNLGQLHDAGVAVMRPRPPLKRQKPWASIVAIGGTALVGLIASVVWMTSRKEPPPPKVERVAEAPRAAPSAEQARTLDADVALDQARAEATRWNSDAVLAAMEVGPFVGGKLLAEGTLRAEFGRPAGAHVGPGAGLHKELLVVTVAHGGVTSSTKTTAGGVGLADPNCIVHDVWSKVLPDVDASARLNLRYERSPRDGRAVYRILNEGSATALRVIDGNNCSFLLR